MHGVLTHFQSGGCYTTCIDCFARCIHHLVFDECVDSFRRTSHVGNFAYAQYFVLDQLSSVFSVQFILSCTRKSDIYFNFPRTLLDAFCKEADSILNHFIDDLHAKVFKFEVSVGGGMMGYHKNFIIDGEPFGKIFEKISKVEKATLVLDIGSPFMESCQVEAVDRLAQKYPDLNIVVCHLLAPRREDGAALKKALPYLKHKNAD